jgi:hypothetical protein
MLVGVALLQAIISCTVIAFSPVGNRCFRGHAVGIPPQRVIIQSKWHRREPLSRLFSTPNGESSKEETNDKESFHIRNALYSGAYVYCALLSPFL